MQRHPVLVDISEFMSNPIRTGIQRTIRQLISHWPADVPVRYVRYARDQDSLRPISARALDFVLSHSEADQWSAAEISQEALSMDRNLGPIKSSDAISKILVPELFFDCDRVRFYNEIVNSQKNSVFFVIYDYVPWLRPELYHLGGRGALALMPYLMLTTMVRHRCFISEDVKSDFSARISRRSGDDTGPVFCLGSEALKLEKQIFDSTKRDIICLGTLEGKKRQDIPFDAYRGLDLTGEDGVLRIIGRVIRPPAPWLERVVDYRGADVEIVDGPPDDVVYDYLRRARALVFTSTGEGFGLPALESLACGIPIIVHAHLPALRGIDTLGQIRLSEISVETITAAFTQVRNDQVAQRLWAEAAEIVLPSWTHFARQVANWVDRN